MSPSTEQVRQNLLQATDSWLKRAAPLLRERALPQPKFEVRFDLRGQSAGQLRRYDDGRLVIRYNLPMALLQPQAFEQETVPHEVAHLVTWLCHGRRAKPHGTEWQTVMRFFGVDQPSRCHSFNPATTSTRQQRRWRYQCDCQEHELSSVRHKRASRGQVYVCRKCQAELRLASEQAVH